MPKSLAKIQFSRFRMPRGIRTRLPVKQKLLIRFRERLHDYVISCGSSDFSVNGKTIELLQTGVQVFEKAPKPVETTPVTTEQPPE